MVVPTLRGAPDVPRPEDYALRIAHGNRGVAILELRGGREVDIAVLVARLRHQIALVGSDIRAERFPQHIDLLHIADRPIRVALYGLELVVEGSRL